ncbi:MAG: hypothetical protein DMD82_13655 [Candidatus Rokuibacteriota bacterium]|nr:MAG: hypothetical protein DMD82_13655 [Candidatus Rokubacteria bacterium]
MKRSVPAVPVIPKCGGVRACMILAIPLSLLLGTFGPATATDGPLFAAPFLSFDTGSGTFPHSIAIGDLNGDGKPDLVAADDFISAVSVLLGNGDGTFGPNRYYETGHQPRSASIGDVNGDGKLDIVTASQGAEAVSVLLGNGDGSLGPKSDYGTGDSPHCVAIGDLNGDGKPDLAVASYNSSAVSVLSGTGTGPSERRTTTGRLQVHTPW